MIPATGSNSSHQNGTDGDPSKLISYKKRKLVLHFDVRYTMIVADTISNITVEQGLNAYLTGVLWGKETNNSNWEWHSKVPTLQPPAKDTTTYYKHLERMMVNTPVDRVALRLAVGNFVHTELGEPFTNFYEKHLALLQWPYEANDTKMTVTGQDGKCYHYVLPAVYKVMQHLHDTNRDFSVIIRTFGLHCENVLNSLKHSLATEQHPQFPDLPDLDLNLHAGNINRTADSITLQTRDGKNVVSEVRNESDIYRFLCDSQGVLGFKDDFPYWQMNNYHHTCSKPLWIDPHDTEHMHIFFDDNYRPQTEDSIVDVRVKDSNGRWKSVVDDELEVYDDMTLVQVDLLDAIANDNYYVQKVQQCEERYEEWQKKKLII